MRKIISAIVCCEAVVRPAWGAESEQKAFYEALAGWGTVALAIVTTILAIYTYRLWRETKTLREDAAKEARAQSENTKKALDISALQTDILTKQKEISRLEFFAAHRPRIIMRNVSMIVEGGEYRLLYSLVNVGGADATISESLVMTEFVENDKPIRNLRCTGHDYLGKVELKAGEDRDFSYPLPADAHLQMAFSETRNPATTMSAGFYFTGSIRYHDPVGTPRTTVFRRVYENGGFRRTDDPDLEYSD